MKRLYSVLALAIILGVMPTLPIKAQITPGKPYSFIDPDHDSHLFTGLDSIVRFAYTNPNDGILNISGLTGPANLQILTLQGRQIINQVINSDKIDLGDLPKGLYILKIKAGEITLTQKLIRN